MIERLCQSDVDAMMTFVTGDPLTADVRAVAVTELLRRDRLGLDRLLERYPELAAMQNRNLSAIPSRALKSTTAK